MVKEKVEFIYICVVFGGIEMKRVHMTYLKLSAKCCKQ